MTKVMVVENDDAIQCLYEQVLRDEGYDVILAEDGLEAVEIFKKERLDIVILDIRMPGMDGIELLGKALDMESGPPVIINKAYSMYKENFLTWISDACLINSSDLSDLKSKIRDLLEEKKD